MILLRTDAGQIVSFFAWFSENGEKPERGDFFPEPAAASTGWPAGSPQKIAVMRLRLEAGEHLHHPGDSQEQTGPSGNHLQAYLPGLREISVSDICWPRRRGS